MRDFSKIYKEDLDIVGKKAVELGELTRLGIPIPDGFVITTSFFKKFLDQTGIAEEIKEIQKISHPAIQNSVEKLFDPIRKSIMRTPIPQNLCSQLHKFYRKLTNLFNDTPLNICTSSENNRSISYSNITGDANTVLKIKTIWSSNLAKPVAIIIMENIKSKIKGKIFTDNPTIDKKLTEKQMNKLFYYCKVIQNHFYFPKQIEYVVKKDKIFITQVNPFTGTVSKLHKPIAQNNYVQKVLVKGISINPGIVTGRVKILHNKDNDIEVKRGEVIVLSNLDPSIFMKIKNAKAVVVDSILPNSLDKTLYRKAFKIPTVEGVKNATKMFHSESVVTVNGVSGEIYSGGLTY